MTAGLSHKLNILERSPLDDQPQPGGPEPAAAVEGQWVASRFNVQATTEDGRLVLWNTFRGSMSVFPAKARPKVKALLRRRGTEVPADGLGGYLRKKGFVVEEEADEYRIFQHFFGQYTYRSDALELMLLSSEDCNFRCEYCYEDFERGTMLPWVREAVKRLVAERAPRLRFLNIGWFGGEPLYGFEAIKDLAPYFVEVAQEYGIRLLSGMTTNGYLLTPEVVDQLLSWEIRHIQVTLDGTPEHHDRLRHTRKGGPSFATIFENLTALADRPDDFQIVVRINFDPQSEKDIEGFLDQLQQLFGTDHRFQLLIRPVGHWGGDNDSSVQICGTMQARLVGDRISAAAESRDLKDYDSLKQQSRFGSAVCYAARPNHFIIGAHGSVMKCSVALEKDAQNVVGHITGEGKLDLDEHKLTLWTEPVHTAESQCKKCVILPLCHGMACPYERILETRLTPCPPLRRNLRPRLLAASRSIEPKTVKILNGR